MATSTRTIHAPRDQVFRAVADPTTYPSWLIGNKGIHGVDDGWPRPGTRFHHRVGLFWPLTVDDSTASIAVEPGRCLELDVRARPVGRGTVRFTLDDVDGGTRVVLHERPTGPWAVLRPIADPFIKLRNDRTLQHLERHVRSEVGSPTEQL